MENLKKEISEIIETSKRRTIDSEKTAKKICKHITHGAYNGNVSKKSDFERLVVFRLETARLKKENTLLKLKIEEELKRNLTKSQLITKLQLFADLDIKRILGENHSENDYKITMKTIKKTISDTVKIEKSRAIIESNKKKLIKDKEIWMNKYFSLLSKQEQEKSDTLLNKTKKFLKIG